MTSMPDTQFIQDSSGSVLPDLNRTAFRYRFTVFTPTHNRAHTLHRVYNSLRSQTFRDFEWLVIDDGSTDHTRSHVAFWQSIAEFPIRYLYQPPQGKHVAYNAAAQWAEGEFLICLDSDDACIPEALERMAARWDELPIQERSRYSGIDAHCMDDAGERIGSVYPIDGMSSNYPEMRYRYRVQGEKWGFQRTEIMRRYPFPRFEGMAMPHIPESVVWSPMTLDYPAWYVNESWRLYYQDYPASSSAPGRPPDGAQQLTKRKLAIANPIGLALMSQTTLTYELQHFWRSPVTFLKAGLNDQRAQWHLRDRLSPEQYAQVQRQMQRQMQHALGERRFSKRRVLLKQLILWSLSPLGYALYQRDRRQENGQ